MAATDFLIGDDIREMARQAQAIKITPQRLEDAQIAQIVAFLESLTESALHTPPFGVPVWFTP
nr:hypothetical protein [Roseobacter litoralis]